MGEDGDVPDAETRDDGWHGRSRAREKVHRDGAGIKAAWRAEAEEQRDRRLVRLRRFWLLLVAAVVLLPPSVVSLLALGSAIVYICMGAVTKAIGAR